jgi:hypothetical protein
MAFSANKSHPSQTATTQYTITLADGKVMVMECNSASSGKVFFSGSTRYHAKAVFEAGLEKIKAAGGTVTSTEGWDFA